MNRGLSGPCRVLKAALLPSARPSFISPTYRHLSQRRAHLPSRRHQLPARRKLVFPACNTLFKGFEAISPCFPACRIFPCFSSALLLSHLPATCSAQVLPYGLCFCFSGPQWDCSVFQSHAASITDILLFFFALNWESNNWGADTRSRSDLHGEP